MTLKRELGRKAIHLGSAVFPVSYWFLDKELFLPIIGVLAIGTIAIDYGRHKVDWIRRLFHAIFGSVLREQEHTTLTGGSTVMAAEFLMVALFPKPVAIASLLTLSIGDSAAAIVGITYGRHTIHKRKTWEGTLAFVVSASVVGWLVPGIPLYAAILAALAAGLVEVLFTVFDDNICIPLASGLTLVLLLGI
ncbi:MAG TPA: SEC59/DGK1/VTE5 family protein [bacterium]|nr:SEC59/DGK1/VTE5 family protein [bacterium]